MNNYFSLLLLVLLIVWAALLLQGKILRYFNLVDRRQLIGSDATYKQINAMVMSAERVSIYSFTSMDQPSVSVNVSYKQGNNETADGRFSTSSLDSAVQKAYAWSVERGFIKE